MKCKCGLYSDWEKCIGGKIYGPCSSDRCTGVCEYVGECRCECHA